ncbi:hypothetical protein Dfri01_55790 [Dyadobacter frigoris]|uniref:hypothetical protein n=1 Tax=Dyadobacter frigoris TaxID=2576211 RepID=UPI0024A49078|nr:hypothetical protein [Dyadobacter frigoris]GLU56118.1 hypothetical protein Dfri01_55790 [Dyadobacter frigoris]
MILGTYGDTLGSKAILEDVVDHVEEHSLRIRIYQIILFLNMTKRDEPVVKEAMEKLKLFANYYNKNLRDIRDFVAHNTVVTHEEVPRIVSSRRYKGKLNSLDVADLQTHVDELPKIMTELLELGGKLQVLYPYEAERELTKKVGVK